MRPTTTIALLSLALLAAPAVLADEATDQARVHFKKGQTHYSLGEFLDAATEFREAYRLRSEPGILFNIGQSMRLLGRNRHAIFYYEQYLSKKTDAANRDEVSALIGALREKLRREIEEQGAARSNGAQRKATEDEAEPSLPATGVGKTAPAEEASEAKAEAEPAADGAPSEARASTVPAAALAATAPRQADASSTGGARLAGYGALGGGVLLEVGAFVFHGSAKSAADTLSSKYSSHTLQPSDSSLRSDVESKGKLATLTAVGGALLLVSGAVLVFAF